MFEPPKVDNSEALPGPSGLSTKTTFIKQCMSSAFRPLITFYRIVKMFNFPKVYTSESLPGPSEL